ncbi:unnamed protein product [Paramecium primaurelia]|uniref:Uncharacterized protein n=1 Tax=Paramecium primaurelia TaxID=5886 RepID=A0A8S1K524_PARPR|nr:unnamed protein product [Paramecium primaurelia]
MIINYGTLITINYQQDHISLFRRREFKQNLEHQTLNREQLQFEEEIYQADKSLIKLTIKCQKEQYEDEIFTYLMSNKSKLQIDSVMMQSINYLDEFHKQINLKKCVMISNKNSTQIDNYEEKDERQDKDNQNSGFSKGKTRQNYGQQDIKYYQDYKNTRGKGRFDRKQGNNGNRQNNLMIDQQLVILLKRVITIIISNGSKKCYLENTKVRSLIEFN